MRVARFKQMISSKLNSQIRVLQGSVTSGLGHVALRLSRLFRPVNECNRLRTLGVPCSEPPLFFLLPSLGWSTCVFPPEMTLCAEFCLRGPLGFLRATQPAKRQAPCSFGALGLHAPENFGFLNTCRLFGCPHSQAALHHSHTTTKKRTSVEQLTLLQGWPAFTAKATGKNTA